jgi:hypothetical protein
MSNADDWLLKIAEPRDEHRIARAYDVADLAFGPCFIFLGLILRGGRRTLVHVEQFPGIAKFFRTRRRSASRRQHGERPGYRSPFPITQDVVPLVRFGAWRRLSFLPPPIKLF